MGLTVFLGLPPAMRAQAARLYWEAFGDKLGRVLGPEPRALVFFERVIRADHCLAAIAADGRLIGIAGFKTPQGTFAGGGWGDLTSVYGAIGGRWRGGLLWALGRDADNDSFLVDGICVTRDARGQGVGSRLLAALYDEARARGYGSIRLEVIDANWRARALYEREGFVPTATQRLGPLRHWFGFSAATTMVRPLCPRDG